MKIELIKETSVDKKTGDPSIYYWVRVFEGDDHIYRKDYVRECFWEEETAKRFYEGCKKHLEKYGTYASQTETLLSETIETPTL